jgi:hypothetical protein
MEQADEIYRKGIQKKAAPLSRLVRQYNAFLIRVEEAATSKCDQPDAPPILSKKKILKEKDLPEFEDEEDNHPIPQRRFSMAPPVVMKTKNNTSGSSNAKSKLKVFVDKDEPKDADLFPSKASTEAVLLSEYDLKAVPKENLKDSEKWNGSLLPQSSTTNVSTKLNVFRDEDDHASLIMQKERSKKAKTMLQPVPKESAVSQFATSMATILADDDKTQSGTISAKSKLVANVQLCYINNSEYSFEENRAEICHKDELNIVFDLNQVTVLLPSKMIEQAESLKEAAIDDPSMKALDLGTDHFASPGKDKGPIQDIFKMFEEEKGKKSINLSYSLSSPKVQKEKITPPSPTMHTKEAMSAISAMFNRSVEDASFDAHMGHEITKTEDAILYNPEDDETISRQVYKRPEPSSGSSKIGVFRDEEGSDEEISSNIQTPFQSRPITNLFGQPVHVMTPVTECSEKTNSYTTHSISTGPSQVFNRPPIILEEDEDNAENTILFLKSQSQNFPTSLDNASQNRLEESKQGEDLEELDSFEEPSVTLANPCNPALVRQTILSKTRPPADCQLHVYASKESILGQELSHFQSAKYCDINDEEKIQVLERFGSSNYFVIRKNGKSKTVLRIQDPPSVWEFYMLFSLQSSISSSLKNSIVKPISCYLFKNESFTELEYIEGGSLLDSIKCLDYTSQGLSCFNNR